MSDYLPEFPPAFTARLREAFLRTGYHVDGVLNALGETAHAALGRGEPEPAARLCGRAGELGTLIRLFLLGETVGDSDVQAALSPANLHDAISAGLLLRHGDGVRAGLDVRPYGESGQSWWVVSDLDSAQTGTAVPSDHVVGAGHASISLARATSRRKVDSLLDLGTGNGVQLPHACRHANRVTATDLSPRALALARATCALNELDVELLEGEWFAPVARRRFDQVICNPPFVVGPPSVDYVYRDSGLAGDDASALLIRQLPGFLHAGGVGQLLASWLHVRGQPWDDRVRGWLPDGNDAWFVQRDVADPALYVGTWLRDAGVDPASPEGRRKAGEWLDWFDANDVEGIGFGFVTVRRTDAEPIVVCEDLRQAYDDPLGAEAADWLDRLDWLRTHEGDLLRQRFVLAGSVRQERIEVATDDGWNTQRRVLHRTDGPGWQHELDEYLASLLAGCRGLMSLSDLLTLLAAAHGESFEDLRTAALPIVRQLVLHGMLLPADWDRT